MPALGITYDLFRCGALGLPSVAENAYWIKGLLGLSSRGVFETTKSIFAVEDGGTVDIGAIARALNLPATPETWARLVSDSAFDADLDRYLTPHFKGISHVVGSGLTPAMMRFLDRAGVRFVDLELAQLRFSQKINFRARTNDIDYFEILRTLAFPQREHLVEAQRAIAARARQEKPEGIRRGIFVGQTHLDLALVEAGRLRHPYDADVMEFLYGILRDLDELHVLPHPGAVSRLGHLVPLVRNLPKTVLGSASTYSMLCHPDTVCAIGLSSGVLREAEFLGVKAHGLIRPDRDNPAYLPESLSDWIEVYDTVLSAESMSAFSGMRDTLPKDIERTGFVEAGIGRNLNSLSGSPRLRAIPSLQTGLKYGITLQSGFESILQYGWSEPEVWGTWSIGQVAGLAFRVNSASDVQLSLRGRIFEHHLAGYTFRPDIEARLSVCGTEVPFDFLREDGAWRMEAILPGSQTVKTVFVHFFIIGACSPSAFDINTDQRKIGVALEQIEVSRLAAASETSLQLQDASYYSRAHREIEGYRVNNWMMPFIRPIKSLGFDTVVECASGNGEFAEVLAPWVKNFWALDWAASVQVPYSAPGFRYVRWDAYKDAVPSGDLVCSADFLEHIRESEIDQVLAKIFAAGPNQFHVVACYDDFHSHLTIEAPDWWLKRFRDVSAECRLDSTEWRLLDWSHRDATRPLAILSNIHFSEMGAA